MTYALDLDFSKSRDFHEASQMHLQNLSYTVMQRGETNEKEVKLPAP